jgi:peroxiredoxin
MEINMKSYTIILLFFCVAFSAEPVIGAADFELLDIDDNYVSLTSLIENGPVLMSFWSLSCKMCIKELDALRPFYDEMDSLGVTILAVSQDKARSVPNVKPFAASHNWNYVVIFDPENVMRDLYHVQAMPTSFIIDQEKNIIFTHQGYKPGDEEVIVQMIRDLFIQDEGCSPEE